jgi:hypothetical protein
MANDHYLGGHFQYAGHLHRINPGKLEAFLHDCLVEGRRPSITSQC